MHSAVLLTLAQSCPLSASHALCSVHSEMIPDQTCPRPHCMMRTTRAATPQLLLTCPVITINLLRSFHLFYYNVPEF